MPGCSTTMPGARSRWITVVSSAIAEAEKPARMIAVALAVKTV